MKQRITFPQLHELSVANQHTIFNWKKDKGYLQEHNTYPNIHLGEETLTIGQMIEFLDEYTNGSDLVIRIHSAGTGWKTPGQRIVDIDGLAISEIEDEVELCDALWEAVKGCL